MLSEKAESQVKNITSKWAVCLRGPRAGRIFEKFSEESFKDHVEKLIKSVGQLVGSSTHEFHASTFF